ncbi:putative esterase [Luteitalea pratensis]|uniref:Putative esterase n=1 Tax=Luteitalea pratensis TaxID=1855912 RepID=A0A143PMA9_LUTPR|nr:phospholipase [Luteitalea pratensis]AMY09735.1 putative esterase [Luteitalea pratensis]
MTTEPREHAIVTPVHGRYLVRVAESPTRGPARNAPMAVGFHGYGESADEQLARLEAIPELADWTLVSIQGLHRFYGRGQAVVASWMTSQDREGAIEDNLRYVRSVITEAVHQTGEPQALVYVGYSQGVAMAWRAAILGARRIDGLAVFGGDVPPELVVRPMTQCPPVLIGRGRDDTQYTAAHFRTDLDMLATRFVAVEPYEVVGGHGWTPAVGREIGGFVTRLIHPTSAAARLPDVFP